MKAVEFKLVTDDQLKDFEKLGTEYTDRLNQLIEEGINEQIKEKGLNVSVGELKIYMLDKLKTENNELCISTLEAVCEFVNIFVGLAKVKSKQGE